MKKIETVKIQNSEYGDIYTAEIQENEDGWLGWIREHPKVKCRENTKEKLLESLQKQLFDTLEAGWKAWDKQIEEDAKAGKLDRLADKAVENYKAGKYYEIDDLKKLIKP